MMKAVGNLRYAGVTSYAGLRYDEIAEIMETQPIDFVQVTYNILDRDAEARILPLAAERKIAVIANRPFREGGLFPYVRSKPLPAIAGDIGAASWAQFILRFIISHPAITAAIPATRRVDHMEENMGAIASPLPDPDQRAAMVRGLNDI
jgi:diketogulonate reductase-like aldo/keto reductase